MAWDLATGARRVMHRAMGYVASFVAGNQTIANDEASGALPGRPVPGGVRVPPVSMDKPNGGLISARVPPGP
jgi:hypothetical protein